ncbi:hypothetical protein KC799_21835, partial [candidate division KSB1 bacterium]|nr:hypothetical protein [candidate division KSB1 bacterium]
MLSINQTGFRLMRIHLKKIFFSPFLIQTITVCCFIAIAGSALVPSFMAQNVALAKGQSTGVSKAGISAQKISDFGTILGVVREK